MLVIGHRGAPNLSIENTIDSFNKAFENGVDGIELDIQLTRDKKIAVFHDFNTHSLDKKNTALKDIDLVELQDISSGFSIRMTNAIYTLVDQARGEGHEEGAPPGVGSCGSDGSAHLHHPSP